MIKFQPKDMGDAADNSSARGTAVRELVKLIVMVFCLAVGLYVAVGFTVDAVVSRLPADTENNLFGGAGYAQGKATGKDKENLAELDSILRKLTAHKEVPALDYRLFIIDDPKPNALAMPGGGIGVTKGLLDKLTHEEIARAFVLGHELGHFKHRDHLRGMGRAVGLQICHALIFGHSEVGGIVGSGTFNLANRKYSRSQEAKADRFGLLLVYKTYGRTQGADKLFRILEKQDKTPGWAYMFATHPAHGKRISALKQYARELSEQSNEK